MSTPRSHCGPARGSKWRKAAESRNPPILIRTEHSGERESKPQPARRNTARGAETREGSAWLTEIARAILSAAFCSQPFRREVSPRALRALVRCYAWERRHGRAWPGHIIIFFVPYPIFQYKVARG